MSVLQAYDKVSDACGTGERRGKRRGRKDKSGKEALREHRKWGEITETEG